MIIKCAYCIILLGLSDIITVVTLLLGVILVNNDSIKHSKKAQKTKQRILDCALELFRLEGYYNVSVDQIVEKAHSSKGAFYNHFACKDELIVSYQEGWDILYADYYETVLQSPDYPGANALDKIREMFCFILQMLCSQGEEVARVSSSYLLRDNKASELNTGRNRKYYEIILSLIGEGKREGVIRQDLDDEYLMRCITILLRGGISDWGISRGDYNLNDFSGFLINTLCENIST